MSYILNALRKSEQQRKRSQPETLETSILERNEPQQKKSSLWLIVLIIVNMIFLGFIISTLLKDDMPELTEKVEETIQTSEKPVAVFKDSHPVSAPDQVKIKKTQQQISIAEKIKQRKPKAKLAITKIDTNKRETKPEKVIEKQTELAPVITKLATAVGAVKASETDKKAKTESIPFLKELPYEFFSKVPELDINVFAYTKEKKARFIMVDMKKKFIGGQVLEGMVLKEIRENSIVVKYKGKVFQIKR